MKQARTSSQQYNTFLPRLLLVFVYMFSWRTWESIGKTRMTIMRMSRLQRLTYHFESRVTEKLTGALFVTHISQLERRLGSRASRARKQKDFLGPFFGLYSGWSPRENSKKIFFLIGSLRNGLHCFIAVTKFQYPRVSPGDQPLAKEPEDSG